MQVNKLSFLVASLLFLSPILVSASDSHPEKEASDDVTKEEINEYIQHHIQDSHSYHLFTDEESGTHIGFPLPVIFWDDGLHTFMSSKFHHGEQVVESKGNYYALHHGKIYKADAQGHIEMDEHHHPAYSARVLDFSITKNVLNIFLIGLLILWMFSKAASNYKKGLAPTGITKFLEPLVIFVRDEIARPNIGEKHYRKYMGYLLTVFFFIWIVNLFGLTPIGVNITNSISVTFGLALITFIITQFSGKKEYWMHIFWMPGVPVPMKIILAPIELLGVFIKPFALMIRLYANITAGHIVLMSIIGLMFLYKGWIGTPLSFGLALFLSVLELLVAALQAYVFTMLTALYFGSAVAEHEHIDEH